MRVFVGITGRVFLSKTILQLVHRDLLSRPWAVNNLPAGIFKFIALKGESHLFTTFPQSIFGGQPVHIKWWAVLKNLV